MRGLRRCERGTSTVEAVVLLPFFLVLLAGVLHLGRLGLAHQEAAGRARVCAWAHALAGCPGTQPAACQENAGSKEAGKGGTGELTQVRDYNDFTDRLGFLEKVVEGFLGDAFTTSHSAEVPALLKPDETVEVEAAQLLLCNPTPPKFGDFLRDIFGSKEKLAAEGAQ